MDLNNLFAKIPIGLKFLKRAPKNVLILSTFPLIALYTFKEVFSYGICCDDILAIYNSLAYGAGKNLQYLFSPYGGQVVGITIMYSLFGLNSQYYFITLYFLRLVAAASVFFLGLSFSKNKLVAIFTSLLFLVGYAGVGTAEYGVLANIFVSLTLLNLGLIMLISYYQKYITRNRPKSYILFTLICLVFASSIIIATVRVNSIIFFYLAIEIGLLFLKTNKMRAAVSRIAIFFAFIFLLKYFGSFGGSSPYHLSMIREGLTATFGTVESIAKATYYNAAIYYDILSPPILDKLILVVLNRLNFLKMINNNTIFLSLFTVIFAIDFSLYKRKHKLVSAAHLMLWLVYLVGFKLIFGNIYQGYSQLPIDTTSYLFQAMNALLGGLFIFLILGLIIVLFVNKQKIEAFKVALSFLWTFIFIFITFLFSPRTFAFDTFLSFPIEFQESYVHYYFIPALGVYFLITYLSFCLYPKLQMNKKRAYLRAVPTVLLVLLIAANATSVKAWIGGRMRLRSAINLENVSQTINSEIKTHYAIERKPIVYFASIDDGKDFFPYAVSGWGFGQFKYSILNGNYKIVPYFLSGTINDVEKIIGNEKFAASYGFDTPVEIDDIYAFEVKDNKVKSVTTTFRKSMMQAR